MSCPATNPRKPQVELSPCLCSRELPAPRLAVVIELTHVVLSSQFLLSVREAPYTKQPGSDADPRLILKGQTGSLTLKSLGGFSPVPVYHSAKEDKPRAQPHGPPQALRKM